MAINETEEEVVEEISEVVEAEPLIQKEIDAIAREIIEANLEKQGKGIMDFEAIPSLLFLGLCPTSSQTRPKLRQSSDRFEWQPRLS